MADEYKTNDKYPSQDSERSEYPRQTLIKFASGIAISVGNQEGKEFFLVSHPSGSHFEFHQDGTVSTVAVGESIFYGKSGGTVTFDENMHMTVTGHVKFSAGGGAIMEIKGNLGIVAYGDINIGSTGNISMASNGNFYIGAKGKFNLAAEQDMTLSSQAQGRLESKGDLVVGSATGISEQAPRIDMNKSGGSSGYVGPQTVPVPPAPSPLTS